MIENNRLDSNFSKKGGWYAKKIYESDSFLDLAVTDLPPKKTTFVNKFCYKITIRIFIITASLMH